MRDAEWLQREFGLDDWAIDVLAQMAVTDGQTGPRAALQHVIALAMKGYVRAQLDPARVRYLLGPVVDVYHRATADPSETHRPGRPVDQRLARFAEALYPDTPLEQITSVVIDAFLRGPGMTEALVADHLQALMPFFQWCVAEGYIVQSPIAVYWRRGGMFQRANLGRTSAPSQQSSDDAQAPAQDPVPVVMLDDYRRG